ncbi:MAG: Methylated-DNA--protein-cysteine methyltransferase [Phycisphaerae bacterium]|nr:Methylated-DNA--protein-cysteine methyltransferase [Phycisphaerae bacterium]
MTAFTLVRTDWGMFSFVSRDGRLVSTYLPASRADAIARIRREFGDVREHAGALPRFQRDAQAYFRGDAVEFAVELDVDDLTPFQRRVVAKCRAIPPGRTLSYGELARQAGKPGAARAVGSVMSHNRLPVVVPCHRVVRSDGSLGGFSSPGGLKDKERLLTLEQRAAATALCPA